MSDTAACAHPNLDARFDLIDGRPVPVQIVCADCGAEGATQRDRPGVGSPSLLNENADSRGNG